jgi:hypothetical protein
MTFLNPYWLLALPLIALPILIHLLNQRRHRSIEWGAMQFLLVAKRMNRGMARIKQVLIMAARMAAIAGLILAVSRPLSSGWVGSLTAGRPETIIVLLDRSASMQQQRTNTGETKLRSGLTKIADALTTLGYAKPVVLIESCQLSPIYLERPLDLLDCPHTTPTETTADITALLQAALDYVADHQTGRTDIWLLSDAAANDWNPENSRWRAIQSGFAKFDGVRFQLLQYPEPATTNLGITLDQIRRQSSIENPSAAELAIDITVTRQDPSTTMVPVTFNVNGLRSVLELELTGDATSLMGYRIPIDRELETGWGSVQIPNDENNSDNTAYFVFAPERTRKTAIVAERSEIVRSIQLAAGTAAEADVEHEVQLLQPDQVAQIDWQATALLVWQAPLPSGEEARLLQRFVESGRSLIFLPPTVADDQSFAGWTWGSWSEVNRSGETVRYWNNDEDLLSRTRNGQPLAVNELRFYQHAELKPVQAVTGSNQWTSNVSAANFDLGNGVVPATPLAQLESGAPLLLRGKTSGGTIYWLTTWPVGSHSSLDREGITLFVAIQRALQKGNESVGMARAFEAGSLPAQVANDLPRLLTADEEDWSITRGDRAGAYGREGQLVALNRPLSEDRTRALARSEVESLLGGLDVLIVEDQIGSSSSLASEIWRLFVIAMGIALIVEAWLCLPPRVPTVSALAKSPPARTAA